LTYLLRTLTQVDEAVAICSDYEAEKIPVDEHTTTISHPQDKFFDVTGKSWYKREQETKIREREGRQKNNSEAERRVKTKLCQLRIRSVWILYRNTKLHFYRI
jgi:hypothetical protein